MKLKDLLNYDNIVIQCHDNPDAHAIASGYGLYHYFKIMGKQTRFIYSGKAKIQKKNLVMLIKDLKIPIEYVTELAAPDLLLLTDCQYGEGNVTRFDAKQVAMIDHHEICVQENEFTEIRSNYGSCSTLVYSMLLEEGVRVNANKGLATALYYGLYMDTNSFGEIKHPFDLDLMEDLNVVENLFTKLKNSNFSAEEIIIAGAALQNYEYNEKERYAIVQTDPCDPNILGFISDMILQVDCIDSCIAYSDLGYGFKLSVRSCRRDVTANDLAQYVTEGLGNGGGHKKKAGGFIKANKYKEVYPGGDFGEYLKQRMTQYFDSYHILDTTSEIVDTLGMKYYKKLPITVGFAKTTDFAPEGTVLVARTLEGDVTINSDPNIYIMIGIEGEVYPIKKKTFEASYEVLDEPYQINAEYGPRVRNKRTEEVYILSDFAKSCVNLKENKILAKQLSMTTKLFTKWYYDDYMLGKTGDYLAVKLDGNNDAYIIKEAIMEKTYQLISIDNNSPE